MTDHCHTCGHSIEVHSGRPGMKNDACTRCTCKRFVRLVTFGASATTTIGQPKEKQE